MVLLFAIISMFSTKLTGPERPRKIFTVAKYGGGMNIIMIPLYSGGYVQYTKDNKVEGNLFCSSKHLFYTSKDTIYKQKISAPGKESILGKLPSHLALTHSADLKHFIRLSGDENWISWPSSVSLSIKSLKNSNSYKITPPSGYRIIHPAAFRPGSDEIFYMVHNSSKGELELRFREISKDTDNLAVNPLGTQVTSVNSFQEFFSPAGDMFAINIDAVSKKDKKLRRYFIILNRNSKSVVATNNKWVFEQFHGFTPTGELTFSGKVNGVHGFYRLYMGKNPHVKLVEPLRGSSVYGYFPGRLSVLFASPFKKCSRPRLESITMWGKHTRLLKWSHWNEIVTLDRHRVWGLFRGGTVCSNKTAPLYLMRTDGSLLLRELPKTRFWPLRMAQNSDTAICD